MYDDWGVYMYIMASDLARLGTEPPAALPTME